MYDRGVRTLILGCTHFPLLKKAIQDVYPDVSLIDSGVEVACEVKAILEEKNLANYRDNGGIELYASDITDSMQMLKEMFFGKNGIVINKMVIGSRV
jgi:glutamate racemase